MIRKIIKIDEKKCNGCGLCANACHEGAIGIVNGKAKLLRDDYCDGLGDCLPTCPTGAIRFEEREAKEYDKAAVMKSKQSKQQGTLPCGCPGTQSKTIHRESQCKTTCTESSENKSQLMQWPVQIKLVPVRAPYFSDANLLVAADCTAYAYGDFHNKFIRNRVALIGCPKLDEGDYSEKLTEIIKNNSIKSVTVVRMEVPCCGGIENAVKRALQNSGKMIPWQVVTIATDGNILD
ncbi:MULTISPECIES: 4Fe-4S binding protein [Caproicibacterium]|jgi:ferredoxin|uniref:4Fe-4S ferredoxin n=1 Tax=Caproicibacterium lactatifermentans TaxID=2666138 RepID=A0A859DNY7_9FIRM|nr:4Fe-4S binding protein [Caproicibacterium lactatifermentans]ARP49563.1 4Fe-4S ferredoxin [Ruminococcaceae bacterium CPB6]MDD4807528.1 4Fe-4S binding protein [Oscillospiraceae bacterium]QKN23165.1 4Fe-4S ferredoxin [Caproicibacterium lactatifermentans]QKO30248.1 4Fe-4S ferredoxin [Caproicibacterium lactatifermentans]